MLNDTTVSQEDIVTLEPNISNIQHTGENLISRQVELILWTRYLQVTNAHYIICPKVSICKEYLKISLHSYLGRFSQQNLTDIVNEKGNCSERFAK